MPGAASVAGVIGYSPIDLASCLPDQLLPKVKPGTIISFTDQYWGGGEAIYLQVPLSTAIKVGAVLAYDVATSFLGSLVANTAIMGKSVAFLMSPIASLATPQYAWCLLSGQGPIWSDASVAANVAIGIVAAGRGGAVAAGKQLNSCRVTLPATTAVVKAGVITKTGSGILQIPNADGWFPGLALTGTGIGAAALITSIDPSGKLAVASVVSTADGAASVTGTYNDATNFFNIATFNRPYIQGPIT